MTVRGKGCMEDTTHSGAGGASQAGPACSEHTHQHNSPGGRPANARQGSHAFKRSSSSSGSSKILPSTSELSEQDTDCLQEHNYIAKAREVDDELPLGSEANSLEQGGGERGDGVVLPPPVDKRLLSLRQGLGGGNTGVGLGQLLHSGWTSFNSDASNLTSGSATSANSVDWLLQERQVDPEQVLLNLGFGGGVPTTTNMYARIPERFLQTQEPEAPQDEDGTQEGAPAEGTPRRNPSRAASAWGRARTMSSAMLSLKVLSSLQHSAPLGLFSSPLGSVHGSASSLTPPGHPRSVLHPDNQRALARQGFYGDNLPEGIEPGDLARREEADEDEEGGTKKSAEDRRKIFHKTRSRRQRSLVESGGEEGDVYSQDSAMKSVDFSTTTESTDSGELSTSAPTTPGDVFLDRAPSPRSAGGQGGGGGGGPAFPVERLTNIDDLYLPDKGSPNTSLTRSRQELTEKLMADLDNDDNYFVSPAGTRQSTIEKAATLTDVQAQSLEEELDSRDGGVGSRSPRTSGEGGGAPHSCRTGNLSFDLNTKSVTIVVSGNGRSQRASPPPSSQRGVGSSGAGSGGGGGGGVNFLSIVNAAVDRLSDSGSEHTLVDHQSSSSGSPRPLNGSESPRPLTGSENHGPLRGSENAGTLSGSVSSRPSSGSRGLEQGPVLFVYHKVSGGHRSPRDVNDNFQDSFPTQGENLHLPRGSQHNLDEDLPRMSSIQSDSSGFGDTEVSGDSAAQEMASLKVSSLGSSCESSGTMVSTSTVLGNSSNNHINNGFHHHTETAATQTPAALTQGFQDFSQQQSKSTDDLCSDSASAQAGSERRFVTMCYIPNLNNKREAGAPAHRAPVQTVTPSSMSSSSPSESRNVLGKTQISVVFRERDRVGKSGGYGTRRGGEEERRKNEIPLSEELALATMQRAAQSSTPRYTVSQAAVTSVPRLALTRATLDTSSVDGSRGSGDELEHDGDRLLAYSSWSRELPGSRPRQRHRHHHHQPGLEGDDGEGGSGTSMEGSSVYSCASTTDSIGSSGSSELLDCHKLMKLINQPTIFKGQKTHLVHYRPKRHLRDWPGLLKKKKLQEETRLAQYAMQKFKTELGIMETSVMLKYQMAYEDMTREEREDVEELQHLWAEVRRQVMETEQLLTSRMKAVAGGNDNFSSLTSISILQRMTELLKEQLFQKQVVATEEEEEEEEREEEEEWEERRHGRYRPRGFAPRYFSSSWAELPRTPRLRGHHSSSTSHLPLSPAFPDISYEQFQTSLMTEVRQELRSSLQALQQDLHKRDSEIHRLQLQLMMEQRPKKTRSAQASSRSLPGSSRRRRDVKETDV